QIAIYSPHKKPKQQLYDRRNCNQRKTEQHSI
ncbi:MAG: hypothetical protein ACI9W3_001034, partial [Marinoscillum sp.]